LKRTDLETSQNPEAAQDKEFVKINGDLIYPVRRNASVNLVVFYHGWSEEGSAYGKQDYVFGRLKGMSLSNTMFIIPDGHGKSYGEVKGTIEELTSKYGITIKSKKLGGWSAGAKGFATAIGGGFSEKMLADPSPDYLMKSPPSGVYMEYNPAAWTGQFAAIGRRQPRLAKKIESNGGTTKLQEGISHDQILDSILAKLA
jgi:hypothetical protein